MNFFPNIPNNGEFIPSNNNMFSNVDYSNGENLFYKINELDNRLRRLEQRIIRLENESNNSNNSLPDNSLYML